MIFTGYFVFVGDIGRPDLLEKAAGIKGTQDEGAKQMYRSLDKFVHLPAHVQVWPGHGAGSACGKALGAVPSTTVGYEKIRNWAFQYQDDAPGFSNYLLEDQPEPPKYFAMMKKLNKIERPLLTEVPQHRKLSNHEFLDAYHKGVTVIDTRSKYEFANGFIDGTINIQGNNSFATWCGWLLNYDEPFILVAPESQMEDLTRKLMRIGLDNVYGYISDVAATGLELRTANVIDVEEFKKAIERPDVQIVDVRNATEYNAGHVDGAKNIFVGTLTENFGKIDKNESTVIHCQSGDRSAIAYSLLVRHGFKNIRNFSGGMAEWKKLAQLASDPK